MSRAMDSRTLGRCIYISSFKSISFPFLYKETYDHQDTERNRLPHA